jgi:hypothetical protein
VESALEREILAIEVELDTAVEADDADGIDCISASDEDVNATAACAVSDDDNAEVVVAASTHDTDNNEDNVAIGKRSSKSCLES